MTEYILGESGLRINHISQKWLLVRNATSAPTALAFCLSLLPTNNIQLPFDTHLIYILFRVDVVQYIGTIYMATIRKVFTTEQQSVIWYLWLGITNAGEEEQIIFL
jgi:hypothetical protein